MENQNKKGILFICATPIGNMEDASFRLIDTLKSVDIIAAEDTRTARKLLSKFNISYKNLESYHDNTSEKKESEIIFAIENGQSAALISESGMPLVSDPGFKLVKKCIEKDISVTVVPGPNAALSALVISGLPVDSFLFLGFLPKTKQKLKKKLLSLKDITFTTVYYESGRRVVDLLAAILEVMGDRECCLAREITKIFEETLRGRVSSILATLKDRKAAGKNLKGEIVIVLDGLKSQARGEVSEKILEAELKKIILQGLSKKEASKILSEKYDISSREIYNIAVKKRI